MSEKEVDSRIQQLLDNEDSDILWDLRVNNTGRPEEYSVISVFLQKCQDFIKGKVETAVDDRRHDNVTDSGESVVHIAMATSACDLNRLKNTAQEELQYHLSNGSGCSSGQVRHVQLARGILEG